MDKSVSVTRSLVNRASTDEVFCQNFGDWLKRMGNEMDADKFETLRGKLYNLVGEFTLDEQK